MGYDERLTYSVRAQIKEALLRLSALDSALKKIHAFAQTTEGLQSLGLDPTEVAALTSHLAKISDLNSAHESVFQGGVDGANFSPDQLSEISARIREEVGPDKQKYASITYSSGGGEEH